MDVHSTANPVSAWLRSLSDQQRRWGLAAVAGLVLLTVWWSSQKRSSLSPIPLDGGLTPAAALAHLHERGLNEAKLDAAGRLVTPPSRAAEARRWLDELQESTSSWADEWEKSNSQLGQFSGSRERDAAKEITRARMIGRLLRQMPGVAQADVIWDEEESAGWRQPQRTRCTVYLRPKPGFEISPDVARSVRQAVAGSKKNLAPGDIVVMDLDRMTTYDAVPMGVDELQRSAAEREIAEIRREIESALQGCAGVRVSVGVSWAASTHHADQTVSLSRSRTTAGLDQRMSLAGDAPGVFRAGMPFSESEPPAFEPRFQVTVTASEDAAGLWAGTSPLEENDPAADGVVQTSFQQTAKPGRRSLASAAAAIRRSVSSVLGRSGREHVPAAVAVHLLPIAKIQRPSLNEVAPGGPIEPLWFLLIATSTSLLGAWILSTIFQRNSTTLAAATATTAAIPVDEFTWRDAGVFTSAPEIPVDAVEESAGGSEVGDFEELIHCGPDIWLQLAFEIPEEVWIVALKGASQILRRTILAGFDSEIRQRMMQAIEHSAPPRLRDIDDCQQQILQAVRIRS